MDQANQYDTFSYSIVPPTTDGFTRYVFATPSATLLFRGVESRKDETVTPPRPIGVVQLLAEEDSTGLIDGPVIRSVGDEHYTRLKNSYLSRPGGQEDWDRLGVDNIMSAGNSANATNTPSIAAQTSDAGNTGTDANAGQQGSGSNGGSELEPVGTAPEPRAPQIGDHVSAADADGNAVAGKIVPAEHVEKVNQLADKIDAGHHETWTREIWDDVVKMLRGLFPHRSTT